MDLAAEALLASRLWEALAFGLIVGGLLWTLGLARFHGSAAAAAAMIAMFLPGGWGGALLLGAGLLASGIASRIAGARSPDPGVPVRLGAAGVVAIGGIAIAAAWSGLMGMPAGYAAAMSAGALAGSGAAWWRRAVAARPADRSSAPAVGCALTAAFVTGALAWELGVVGPGDGILPFAGATIALALVSRFRLGLRRELVATGTLAASGTLLLMALLP